MFLVCTVLTTGCATTLATHQTARAIEPGHVQATAGTGVYIPVGATLFAISEGVAQTTKIIEAAQSGAEYQLTDDDREKLITAAIALAVLPPSPTQEFSLRTGILKNWDAGLRYSISAVRLDSKYQLYHADDGPNVAPEYQRSVDLAVGGAVSKYLFDNVVFDALEFVQMGDFDRWDFEVPVYASIEWGYIFKAYGAVKYVYSHTTMDARLVNTANTAGTITGLDIDVGDTEVGTHFIGATAGIMAGYRYVYVGVELTGGYTYARPFVLGRRRDLGGATFYPSIALDVRF